MNYIEEIKKFEKNYKEVIEDVKEMILANLVMLSQIPSPTFHEQDRARFIMDRFIESEILTSKVDKIGNVFAKLKGRNSDKRIVVAANIDTPFPATFNHNVRIERDKAIGAGVASNSAAVAVMITLPEIIKRLGVEFNSDIVFLGTVRTLGRGDVSGMREYLNNCHIKPDYVINLLSTSLGQVDHFSNSAIRCDIRCDLEEHGQDESAKHVHGLNSICIIDELVNSILGIPLPSRPYTKINLGMISGGESYDTPGKSAKLSLEVRSESDEMTDLVKESIKELCIDVGSKYGVKLRYNFFGRQHAGGLRVSHPLVKRAVDIVEYLGNKPLVGPSNTQVAVPAAMGIPSISLGLTNGGRILHKDSYVEIEPITNGILQVMSLIEFIEKGYCDEKIK